MPFASLVTIVFEAKRKIEWRIPLWWLVNVVTQSKFITRPCASLNITHYQTCASLNLIHYQACTSLNLIHYQNCASLNLIHYQTCWLDGSIPLGWMGTRPPKFGWEEIWVFKASEFPNVCFSLPPPSVCEVCFNLTSHGFNLSVHAPLHVKMISFVLRGKIPKKSWSNPVSINKVTLYESPIKNSDLFGSKAGVQ